MTENGFVSLHRKILKWGWYKNANTMRLFIHCLLKANFCNGKFENIEVKRGQFVTSRNTLSSELGLSEQQIKTALNHLKSTGEITTKAYSKFTVITVENYNYFQDPNQSFNHQSTNSQPTDNQQPTVNQPQYNKNNKNNKNNNSISSVSPVGSKTPKKKLNSKNNYQDNETLNKLDEWFNYGLHMGME